MAGAITGISGIRPPEMIRPEASPSGGSEFHSVLAGAIDRVEKLQAGAAQSIERYLSGDNEELHTAAIATQEAELALDMFMQTRNKVVSAYQEIMRMQM